MITSLAGSIIRMNPYYIHIDDPDYFDEIYAVGKRRDKSLFFNPGAGTSHPMSGSMFLALDHDLHKQRRGAVASLFSRNAIRNLQPVVDERVNYAMNKLHQEYVNGTVVNLSDLNAGLTLDVISTYCFGDKLNSLEGAADGKTWRAMLTEGATGNNFGRHFPWFVNTVATLSPDVQKKLAPKQAPFILWAQSMKPVIKNILDGKRNASNEHQTIFHEIRDSNLPDAEKDPQRLMGEAFVFIGAGTETTARTLSVLHFYLAKDFAARERLFQELKQVMPTVDSPITLEQAQKLPYFVCITG